MMKLKITILYTLLIAPQVVRSFRSSCAHDFSRTAIQIGAIKKNKNKGSKIFRALNEDPNKAKKKGIPDEDIWTEISGISLPRKDREIKAWDLNIGSQRKVLVAARSGDKIFVLDGECSKCAWDMWKGQVVSGERIACPLCGSCYSLANGDPQGSVQRSGFSGFVGGLANQATSSKESTTLGVYPLRISASDDGTPLIKLDLRRVNLEGGG